MITFADTEAALGDPVLTILHTNDTHGRFSPNARGEIGGAGVSHDLVSAVFKSYDDDAILLAAGDMIFGTFVINQSGGLAAIEIMNAAGYDAMTLGNHEFNYGWDELIALSEVAEFPFLTQLDDAPDHFKPYVVLERGGLSIGVFGITTPAAEGISTGAIGKDFGTLAEVIKHAQSMIDLLRDEYEVDLVICLAHMGIDAADATNGLSYDIRDGVTGLDLIIDGHSHSRLTAYEQVEGKALVVSAHQHGEALGVVEVYLVDGAFVLEARTLVAADLAELDLEPCKDVLAVLETWEAVADEVGAEIVVTLEEAIPVIRSVDRVRESVMGNLVTDAFRAYTGAQVAFTNGGGIRDTSFTSIAAGDVSYETINDVFPFGNIVVMTEMKGSVLLAALEHGLRAYPTANGGFLQVSGLIVLFDPESEARSRVVNVFVNGVELDPNATYTVATNDFTGVSGGDGYRTDVPGWLETFQNLLPIENEEIGNSIPEVLIWYLNNFDYNLGTQRRIRYAPPNLPIPVSATAPRGGMPEFYFSVSAQR
jgi:5'-nucleotidase